MLTAMCPCLHLAEVGLLFWRGGNLWFLPSCSLSSAHFLLVFFCKTDWARSIFSFGLYPLKRDDFVRLSLLSVKCSSFQNTASKHVPKVTSRRLFWHLSGYGLQLSDTPPVPWSKNNHDQSKIGREQLNTAEKPFIWGKKMEGCGWVCKCEIPELPHYALYLYHLFWKLLNFQKFATKLKRGLFSI